MITGSTYPCIVELGLYTNVFSLLLELRSEDLQLCGLQRTALMLAAISLLCMQIGSEMLI